MSKYTMSFGSLIDGTFVADQNIIKAFFAQEGVNFTDYAEAAEVKATKIEDCTQTDMDKLGFIAEAAAFCEQNGLNIGEMTATKILTKMIESQEPAVETATTPEAAPEVAVIPEVTPETNITAAQLKDKALSMGRKAISSSRKVNAVFQEMLGAHDEVLAQVEEFIGLAQNAGLPIGSMAEVPALVAEVEAEVVA